MHLRFLALLALIAAGLGLSCGGDDSEGNTTSNAVDRLGTELTAVHCTRLLTCCSDTERIAAFQGLPVADEEECQSTVEGILQANVLPRYEAAIEAGTVAFLEEEIEGCIAGVERVACDSFLPDPRLPLVEIPACRGLWDPQLETTEFCTDDFECRSGFCAIDASGEEGTCAEPPTDGDPCLGGVCAENHFCDMGTCTSQLVDGEGCDNDSMCISLNCVDTNPNEGTDLRCAELPPACTGS